MKLTEPQQKALKALHDRGGEGVLDKAGWLVARGERIRFDTITWLRLVTLGMIEPAGPLRLRITTEGQQAALTPPPKLHANSVGRRVEALEGAE